MIVFVTWLYSWHQCNTTGWRRPIGCLKLQVILRKRATNYRAHLRKMTYEDKAPYDSMPPCTVMVMNMIIGIMMMHVNNAYLPWSWCSCGRLLWLSRCGSWHECNTTVMMNGTDEYTCTYIHIYIHIYMYVYIYIYIYSSWHWYNTSKDRYLPDSRCSCRHLPWLSQCGSWQKTTSTRLDVYLPLLHGSAPGMCVTWLNHMCVMMYSYVWKDPFMCVAGLWRALSVCVTGMIHMCSLMHSYDCLLLLHGLAPGMSVTWLINVCDMTHSCVWHDSFICVTGLWRDSCEWVTWLGRMCNLMHSYVCYTYDEFICLPTNAVRIGTCHLCDMTHSCVWHDAFMSVTWCIHMCDVTHSYVWHDSFIWVTWLIWYVWHNPFTCVTWLIHMCDTTHSYGWHDAFTCMTWLIHMGDMAHSQVWHDPFICVTWLIHDMTHSYVWHDPFIYVTWPIHVCDMTHSHVWHDSFTCMTWLIHMSDMTHSHVCHDPFICVTWPIHDMTHSYVWHDLFIYVT